MVFLWKFKFPHISPKKKHVATPKANMGFINVTGKEQRDVNSYVGICWVSLGALWNPKAGTCGKGFGNIAAIPFVDDHTYWAHRLLPFTQLRGQAALDINKYGMFPLNTLKASTKGANAIRCALGTPPSILEEGSRIYCLGGRPKGALG